MTEPDRDPLIDKLIEMFGPAREAPSGPTAWSIGLDPRTNPLMGIPIEQAAEMINKRYLGEVSRKIAEMAVGSDWNPADWTIACPPYLFHGWEVIDGVRVCHTNPLDWSVLFVRRPDWSLPWPGVSYYESAQDHDDIIQNIRRARDLIRDNPNPYNPNGA